MQDSSAVLHVTCVTFSNTVHSFRKKQPFCFVVCLKYC